MEEQIPSTPHAGHPGREASSLKSPRTEEQLSCSLQGTLIAGSGMEGEQPSREHSLFSTAPAVSLGPFFLG